MLERHRWLRWVVLGLVILVIILYQAIRIAWGGNISPGTWIVLDILILVLFVSLAYFAYARWQRSIAEQYELASKLAQAEAQLSQAYQRQEAILRISQLFSEAKDDHEVVEQVLRYALDLLEAKGASFVPLDERAQPQTAVSLGEIPEAVNEAWMEYLASPAIRGQCGACQNYERLTCDCPLIKGSPLEVAGMYCLPIRRGDQEFGVLNLYIPSDGSLEKEKGAFLLALVEETSLALEAVRMRKRAMITLRQLQAAREKADLNSLLSDLLDDLPETLDADYAMVTVWDRESAKPLSTVSSRELPENTRHLVDGILRSVITSKEPVLLGNVSGDAVSSPGVRTLMAVPLVAQDQPAFGAILVANQRPKAFNQSQLATLQTIAGQVAQVILNINLMAQLEYNTIVQERTRLAREIHDGVAQTLGFLKLKIAQMRNYIENGQTETLRQTVDICSETLAEAYQDARLAIDGLRILPSEEGLAGWLHQTSRDFGETTGIQVDIVEPLSGVDLPPEIHAQLIRIVQEALSNIRKHAEARHVTISCVESLGDLVLEVRDDGTGFSPEDVPGPSQHGLRGMRERAELIGADFQVIGLPTEGTTIRVCMPLSLENNQI